MENLIRELKTTNSRNEKFDILMKYASNLEIKEAFRLCYDPFEVFNIKAKILKEFGYKTFSEMFDEFTQLTDLFKNRILTGNAAKNELNTFLLQCTKEAQEIFVMILNKSIKSGVSIATLTKVYGKDFLRNFKVQLANKWEEDKNYNVDYWFSTPKLDGLRGIFFHSNPSNLNINYTIKTGVLYTRGATEITGFEHINQELNDLCITYDLEFVDGELFSKNITFETIQGYILSYKNVNEEHKKKILFNIFVLGKKYLNNTKGMIDIINSIDWSKYQYIVPLKYEIVDSSKDSIYNACYKAVGEKHEGLMLRDPYNWYSWDRDNFLLKVKLFKEADLTITDIEEGTLGSKNENKMGNLIVQGIVENKKIVSNVGSGFSDEQRSEIWNNKEEYIGRTVEVQYQNVTTSENTTDYSLRFPVFRAIKKDR